MTQFNHSGVNSRLVKVIKLMNSLPPYKIERLEREGLIKVKNVVLGTKRLYKRDFVFNPHKYIGLTKERIQKFHTFTADDADPSFTCGICLGQAVKDTKLIRLDCDGRHVFCQCCIEKLFEMDNQCPICRHTFQNK